MSMIKVSNLTFSYPNGYEDVFSDVSFQIDTDWKLGLIGRNGRGKTTLLRILTSDLDYKGSIISSVQFDYFPYPVKDPSRSAYEIFPEIAPQAEDWELIRELSYLEMDAEKIYLPFSTLSKGEQTKVLLAALFLNQGHFLLIDEPTNHLDSRGRELVSAYLNRKKGFILVSHDRRFLDGCVDHILSINRSDIEVQSGNFSSWKENFDRKTGFELAKNERLKKDIDRLRTAGRRSAAWSDQTEKSKVGAADKGFVGHKAAKMMQRSKNIEERRQKAIEEKSTLLKNVETEESLKLYPLSYHSNLLATVSDLAPVYDGRAICRPLSFTIEQGDRIAVRGRNGSGKSSLLKILLGRDIQHTGSLQMASGLIISYVPQTTSHLKGTLSDYAEKMDIDETLFRSILRKMDFERSQFDKEMTDYSEGQKKKVLLAASLCQKAHLYIWDEPLNYIDIYSRLQLENLILAYKPTLLFIEHDAAFCEEISTKTIEIS